MNNIIQKLPEILTNRIAAGEVVERPASVVKELMENAIDAEATSISLMLKNSGLSLIQVVDDGHGMSEDDALICCERHATSKISSLEDLESIDTMGFRGEALASISSVSRMTLTTSNGEGEATQIVMDGGHIRDVLKTAANRGTTVIVKDLFANVPARRKFMKSPATELRHVMTVFRRIALAHPEIDFNVYIEDEKTIDLRRGNPERRVRDILTDKRVRGLIPVEKEIPGLKITGYISRPGDGQGTRKDQFLFLNRRFIVNKSVVHAILSAYSSRLGRNEYPVYILNIEMEPRFFDVNVHPTKIEVRFLDDRFVHETMRKAIQHALQKPSASPELHLVPPVRKMSDMKPHHVTPEDMGQLTLDAQRTNRAPGVLEYHRILETEKPTLWQLHDRYILSQIKSGITIIDQHVAHERILYERALASRRESMGMSQQLLFPQTIEFSPDDYLTLTEILPHLESIGFGLKEFGKNTVIMESVPVDVKNGREKDLLFEIMDSYKEEREETKDVHEAVAMAFACKCAIKSGDRLTTQEMAQLIDQLFATEEPYFCPHGRPIVVNLTLDEIDKRFGR